jgi:F-type H+-transporting ATPase subunit a
MNVATDPMHQFQVTRLFELNIGGVDISFTNSALFMVLGVLLIIGFFAWALSRPQTVPSRKQSMAEIWYGFVAGIVKDVNHEDGKPFVPLIFTIFSFIFVANILGMLPHAFTTTSHIVVTGAMALFTFFLVIIEIFSFLSRPLSLGMRLFANMLGGHVALKVFAGFIPQLAAGLGILGAGMAAVLVMPLVIGVTALELLVAFLQAYVFAILTCIYLNDALHPGGH